MAPPERLELPTCGLGNRRSVLLSYGGALGNQYFGEQVCSNRYVVYKPVYKTEISDLAFFTLSSFSIARFEASKSTAL